MYSNNNSSNNNNTNNNNDNNNKDYDANERIITMKNSIIISKSYNKYIKKRINKQYNDYKHINFISTSKNVQNSHAECN